MAKTGKDKDDVLRMSRIVFTVVCAAVVLVLLVVLYDRGESWDGDNLERIDHMYQEYTKDFPDVPAISVGELVNMRSRERVVVVDVRKSEECEVSMIPRAISVGQFESNIEEYKDHVAVAYCTAGKRSGVYAKKLLERRDKVYNLRGGILAWVNCGQPVVDLRGQTERVHVYGARWNILPPDYQGQW